MASDGTPCPDGSYNAGKKCAHCSGLCMTCNGPSSNNCIDCRPGQVLFNGSCTTPDSDGVCEGSNGMIADNNKRKCDGEVYNLSIWWDPKLNIFF